MKHGSFRYGWSKIFSFFFFRSVIAFIGNRLLVLKGLPHLTSLQLLFLLQPELEAGLLQIWVVEDLELLLFLKILQCHVLSLLFC